MLLHTILAVLFFVGSHSVTVQVDPRSTFCFYEDVKIVEPKHEGKEFVKFVFTVLKGGKYKDIIAMVESLQGQRGT